MGTWLYGFTLDDMMKSWTQQLGYPVVTFNYSKADQTVHLSQEIFLTNPNDTEKLPKSEFG